MPDSVHSIRVEPEAHYAEEQSDVAADVYVFHYHIQLTNTGKLPARLISRHWIITDANERVQEVRGMGVVGEQPEIEPGQTYEYSSSTSLKTPYGSMHGHYHFVASDGTRFEAEIPEMQLVAHRILH
jgi:ApaG protein